LGWVERDWRGCEPGWVFARHGGDGCGGCGRCFGGGTGLHAFGEANWWGEALFGIDNALVGNWPVVVIENGKAVIKACRSIPDWWSKHNDVMIKHFEAMGEMFYQRT
jgi:hypothetical protein